MDIKRILKTSWTVRVYNEEVRRINKLREVMIYSKQRKLQ